MSKAVANQENHSRDREDFRAATVMKRADSDPRNSQNSGDLADSFSLPDKLAVPHARKLLLFSVGILCVFSSAVFAQEKKTQKKPKIDFSKPLYSISKETTFVTGPLKKDGHIDFVGAINNRYSKGVTPQNNAAVLYLKAMGPPLKGDLTPKRFYAQLGIPVLPVKGNYFLDFDDYLYKKAGFKRVEEDYEKMEKLDEQRELAQRQVWRASDYPHVAKWLKYNEQSLKIIIEGTKRSHYYMPVLVPTDGDNIDHTLADSLLPFPQISRAMARALACRAMLKINEEKFDEAWQDLLAGHRLSRHVGHGFSLIEALVSYAVEMIGYRADLVFLEHSKPTAAQVSRYLKDLNALPPLADTIEKYNFGERLSFVDSVTMISRNIYSGKKGSLIGTLGSGGVGGTVYSNLGETKQTLKYLLTPYPNWSIILKQGNRTFDKVIQALRIQDSVKRAKAFEVLNAEFAKYSSLRPKKIEVKAALKSNKEISKRIGKILVGLMLPAFEQGLEAETRMQQRHNNLMVAFALTAYKSDHGKYPAKLSDLSPKYVAKIPNDLYTGKPLNYKPTKDGYLLYSVGRNGKDDGGKRELEIENGPDDIAIRMPIPKEK